MASSLFKLDLENTPEDILAAKLKEELIPFNGAELREAIHLRSRGKCDLMDSQQCQFILKDYLFFTIVLTVEFILTEDKSKIERVNVTKT
jgi:hypothetical protein